MQIALHTHIERKGARQFYEQLGYEITTASHFMLRSFASPSPVMARVAHSKLAEIIEVNQTVPFHAGKRAGLKDGGHYRALDCWNDRP